MKTKNNRRNCAYLGDMKRRSWCKSLVWRLMGILILGAIAWVFTRSWEQTSLITVIFHGIRLVLYYLHERVWDNVEWGRIRVTEEINQGEGI